ncbi:hypothetical protein P3X46_000893 [Hevea brasiliensis]|uniref:Leucine-rich repeat-containing N-terminal plant-type domain-containing protein n=1 Tax=Hevea brasiliensis TaxID=3981 RepID=A0ABQ9NFY2_HEVBR|nr:hypothetical protein P3X46_000893 [Hevea brasiliensis]
METFPSFLWILLLLVCMMGEGACARHAEFVECNESDRKALLDFKEGLVDRWDRLSSWQGSKCCQWWGIDCDNKTGAVIAVDIHNPAVDFGSSFSRYGFWFLGGEIRPSLPKLKSLRSLDLSFNTFNAEFLISFRLIISESLENLRYLNLSNAWFKESNIPQTLGNLSNLQVLDISTSFANVTVDNLEWLSGLVSLKYLAMNGVNLEKVGVGWVKALNKLPSLTELHLNDCQLSSLMYFLPSVNLTSLAVLKLRNNNFNSELPNWIVNISSLITVDLSFCSLNGRIPHSFSELPNLQCLKLSGNLNLSASCSQLFRGSWKKIQILDLAVTKLHGRFPFSLGNMTSLVYLDLSDNFVEGSIPSYIGRLCNLQYIDVSFNNLTEGLPELLEFESCPCRSPLPRSKFFASKASGLAGKLPNWLGHLKSLVVLDLSHNKIEGPIPSSFGNLQRLSELRLYSNRLNGTLPDGVVLLSELTFLNVAANQLTGVISETFFSRLGKLKFLILSANSFISSVNSDWVPPFQVSYLYMGSCILGPPFPTWLRHQKEITNLDFSNASISSSIPSWFWDISGNISLLNFYHKCLDRHLPNPLSIAPCAIVDLSSNLFKGIVPLPSVIIEALDLSNNQFSGYIPENIGEIMPNLLLLSLSSNRLTGAIPTSLGKMLSLDVIDHSRNNLTGSMPSTIGNCQGLSVLDLQQQLIWWDSKIFGKVNLYLVYGGFWLIGSYIKHYYQENLVVNVHGQFHKYTKTLSLLTSIDLSRNNFHGEIPEKLTKLVGLLVFNSSENHISGQIPQSISELHQLLSLDLSSNRLSGPIPPSTSSLTFLENLNLSDNNLSGTIPYSNQMSTFNASSFAGNPGLCGFPLDMKCLRDDSNNGGSKDGSYDGEKDEVDDGNGFFDNWLDLSIGLGFAAGLLLPFLIFLIKRSWGGVYFAFVDWIVDSLSSMTNRIATGRRIQHSSYSFLFLL